jgi:hypothetical protein
MGVPNPADTELLRLRYGHGQMLRSRDARDEVRVEAQLRWWHNRALHRPFGVIEGLTVTGWPPVTVEPGLAYDCFGRELLQTHRASVPVPTADTELLLLATYDETATSQRLAFAWKPAAGVGARDGVPLARLAEFSSAPLTTPLPDLRPLPGTLRERICHDTGRGLVLFQGAMSEQERDQLLALSSDSDYQDAVAALFAATPAPALAPCFRRLPARSLARPRLQTGATIPGATAWEPWLVPLGEGPGELLGVQVVVDTSSAGFTDIPCYFAWVQGAVGDERARPVLAAHLAHLDSLTPTSFRVRLWLPWRPGRVLEPDALARREGLSICWLGIQASTSSEVNHGHP